MLFPLPGMLLSQLLPGWLLLLFQVLAPGQLPGEVPLPNYRSLPYAPVIL